MHPHRNRLLRGRHGDRARAKITLVAPLEAPKAFTAMRPKDTAQLDLFGEGTSSAVSRLIAPAAPALRPGDVDSANDRSTPTTRATPGTRTSTGATRTTGTRATSSERGRSAAWSDADFSFAELLAAWRHTRRHKATTAAALEFDADQEARLVDLHERLLAGTYRPGRSVCFGIERPKDREVWAAPFEDRIPHHALYLKVGERFERAFIADTCACIPGRGTHYAARRLESKVRALTHNWRRPGWYLKCDIRNFFVSIHKPTLAAELRRRIPEPFWRWLAELILFHDPRPDVDVQGNRTVLERIPRAKSLFHAPADCGLPIGNLSSQFFANVHLNPLDQFIKHRLRARHYVRYVDDLVLLAETPTELNLWRAAIDAFLPGRLRLELNPGKTIIQPIERGIDFVGQVIKPHRRTARRRTYNAALSRLAAMPAEDLATSATSSLGLLRQASRSHTDRARLANVVRRRGLAVDHHLTKVYP